MKLARYARAIAKIGSDNVLTLAIIVNDIFPRNEFELKWWLGLVWLSFYSGSHAGWCAWVYHWYTLAFLRSARWWRNSSSRNITSTFLVVVWQTRIFQIVALWGWGLFKCAGRLDHANSIVHLSPTAGFVQFCLRASKVEIRLYLSTFCAVDVATCKSTFKIFSGNF